MSAATELLGGVLLDKEMLYLLTKWSSVSSDQSITLLSQSAREFVEITCSDPLELAR